MGQILTGSLKTVYPKSNPPPTASSADEHTEATNLAESVTDSVLEQAISQFKKNYSKFANKNQYISNVKDDFGKAMEQAASGKDIKATSKLFEERIAAVMEAKQSKQDANESKWTGKVGGFLKAMYPIAIMSLQLASSAGEVNLSLEQVSREGGQYCASNMGRRRIGSHAESGPLRTNAS